MWYYDSEYMTVNACVVDMHLSTTLKRGNFSTHKKNQAGLCQLSVGNATIMNESNSVSNET